EKYIGFGTHLYLAFPAQPPSMAFATTIPRSMATQIDGGHRNTSLVTSRGRLPIRRLRRLSRREAGASRSDRKRQCCRPFFAGAPKTLGVPIHSGNQAGRRTAVDSPCMPCRALPAVHPPVLRSARQHTRGN